VKFFRFIHQRQYALVGVIAMLVSCDKYSGEIDKALNTAGRNRGQLETVLNHYKSIRDTLGYKSAVFLVKNMPGLGVRDSTYGEFVPDVETISASYLISNIDLALQSARSNILEGQLSFKDFCEYVLPYRLSQESLINWRRSCLREFSVISKPGDAHSTYRILYSVNDSLRKAFKFSYTAPPAQIQNWQELNAKRQGDCWVMSSTAIYPLRAIGIPVSIDFVPTWGNVNGGSHAWNVVINQDGSSNPFMGCESTSSGYGPFNIYNFQRKPPKVFRRTFSAGIATEFLKNRDRMTFPPDLRIERSIDVTNQYVTTADLTVQNSRLRGENHAFVSVYSNGTWKPVFWTKVNGEQAVFKDMATGVLYMICVYVDGQLLHVGSPLYIDDTTKSVIELKTDLKNPAQETIIAHYLQSKELDEQLVYNMPVSGQAFYDTMDSVKANRLRSRPKVTESYALFYYQEGWRFHSSVTKKSAKPVVFESVPASTIYKILSGNSGGHERIFSYEHGKQIWW